MPKYTELVIHADPKNNAPRWYGPDARALLAFLTAEEEAQTGTSPIPPAFFHYRDRLDGATFEDLPPVRFATSKSAIRIIGLGEQGEDLLMGSANAIARILARHYRKPLKIDVNRGNMDIDLSNRPWRYVVKSLVFTVKPERYRQYMQADEVTRRQMVAKLIVGGKSAQGDDIKGSIERMCDLLGIPMPSGLEVAVTGLGPDVPELIKDKGGKKSWALVLREAMFILNAELTGPWSIGHLQSRGHGAVICDRYVSADKIDPRVIAYVA